MPAYNSAAPNEPGWAHRLSGSSLPVERIRTDPGSHPGGTSEAIRGTILDFSYLERVAWGLRPGLRGLAGDLLLDRFGRLFRRVLRALSRFLRRRRGLFRELLRFLANYERLVGTAHSRGHPGSAGLVAGNHVVTHWVPILERVALDEAVPIQRQRVAQDRHDRIRLGPDPSGLLTTPQCGNEAATKDFSQATRSDSLLK